MGKELTECEAIKRLDNEFSGQYRQISEKYRDVKKFWRDKDYIKSNKILDEESARRFFKLKETYAGHETLPEAEVMKIVTGDF